MPTAGFDACTCTAGRTVVSLPVPPAGMGGGGDAPAGPLTYYRDAAPYPVAPAPDAVFPLAPPVIAWGVLVVTGVTPQEWAPSVSLPSLGTPLTFVATWAGDVRAPAFPAVYSWQVSIMTCPVASRRCNHALVLGAGPAAFGANNATATGPVLVIDPPAGVALGAPSSLLVAVHAMFDDGTEAAGRLVLPGAGGGVPCDCSGILGGDAASSVQLTRIAAPPLAVQPWAYTGVFYSSATLPTPTPSSSAPPPSASPSSSPSASPSVSATTILSLDAAADANPPPAFTLGAILGFAATGAVLALGALALCCCVRSHRARAAAAATPASVPEWGATRNTGSAAPQLVSPTAAVVSGVRRV